MASRRSRCAAHVPLAAAVLLPACGAPPDAGTGDGEEPVAAADSVAAGAGVLPGAVAAPPPAIDGYTSRLHYFSEWITNNEQKGLLRDITRELGGTRADEPIDFMSSNADAYPALEDADELSAIRAIERRLSAETRYFTPNLRSAPSNT